MDGMQTQILQNTYEYYLIDPATGAYVQIESEHVQSENAAKYISGGLMRLVVGVVEMGADKEGYSYDPYSTSYAEQLALPKIWVRGYMK